MVVATSNPAKDVLDSIKASGQSTLILDFPTTATKETTMTYGPSSQVKEQARAEAGGVRVNEITHSV